VDPYGKVVSCITKNLDHVKIMQVEESVRFGQTPEGFVFYLHIVSLHFISFIRQTLQQTEARIISNFGWGLTKQIENHGLNKFKTNLQRVSPFNICRSKVLTSLVQGRCERSTEFVETVST
jgi:hypothetical protein